ncbi:hypothetical protein DL98DRAFT_41300 [Cadophora sp. DSE1049]|nr:hypothetical protein DL98DRAFT_41300 [Cadophora sp. DSE1049]
MELCNITCCPGRQISCVSDHVYYIGGRITAPHKTLPAFRGGMRSNGTNGSLVSGPPYLVTEERSSPALEHEAMQYLSFVLSAHLHEQLLLYTLTKSAQDTSTIPFTDFKIFGMTNCGQQVKFFQMEIRPAERSQSRTDGYRYIRYDLVKIADLDLTREEDCEALKSWMNYIHHWALTVHMPMMKAKAKEVLNTEPDTSEAWIGKLLRTAFYHDKQTDEAKTLKYRILEDRVDPLYFDARPTRKGENSAHISISSPETILSTPSRTKVLKRNNKPARSQLNPAQSTLLPNNDIAPSTKSTSISQLEGVSDSTEKYNTEAKQARGRTSPRHILAERSLNTIRSSNISAILEPGKTNAQVERPESRAFEQSATSTPRLLKSTAISKLPPSATKSRILS